MKDDCIITIVIQKLQHTSNLHKLTQSYSSRAIKAKYISDRTNQVECVTMGVVEGLT